MDDTKMRQCTPGELCWVAAVTRPDFCARMAEITSRSSSLRRSDVYLRNYLARGVNGRREATELQYASPPRPRRNVGYGGRGKDDMRSGEEKLPRGATSSFRQSDV